MKDKIRLVFTDSPGTAIPEHKGKVFAVIGPFDAFTDKEDLQDALKFVCRGWNFKQ